MYGLTEIQTRWLLWGVGAGGVLTIAALYWLAREALRGLRRVPPKGWYVLGFVFGLGLAGFGAQSWWSWTPPMKAGFVRTDQSIEAQKLGYEQYEKEFARVGEAALIPHGLAVALTTIGLSGALVCGVVACQD